LPSKLRELEIAANNLVSYHIITHSKLRNFDTQAKHFGKKEKPFAAKTKNQKIY